MIQGMRTFANQLLICGGFRISEFPKRAYRELLTALSDMQEDEVTFIPGMVEWAKAYPGYVVIDDTKNPKYGLHRLAKRLRILTNGATRTGYEVLLLLWVVPGFGRFPIGFALGHKETGSPASLALQAMGLLRNRHDLRPLAVLADGAFSTDDGLKRVTDYGWAFVMRSKNTRKVNGIQVKQLIPRGYGETEGYLQNWVKVKVVRDRKHFLFCNRMLMERQAIQALYRLRWKIEEVFRILKSGLGLDGCQQHSMHAQGIFIGACLVLFSYLEIVSGGNPYSTLSNVISGHIKPENIICEQFVMPR
jgi:DDE family transposase